MLAGVGWGRGPGAPTTATGGRGATMATDGHSHGHSHGHGLGHDQGSTTATTMAVAVVSKAVHPLGFHLDLFESLAPPLSFPKRFIRAVFKPSAPATAAVVSRAVHPLGVRRPRRGRFQSGSSAPFLLDL